jgi:hypothetical protein
MVYSMKEAAELLEQLVAGELDRDHAAEWAIAQQTHGYWENEIQTDPPGHEAWMLDTIRTLTIVNELEANDMSQFEISEGRIADLLKEARRRVNE